MKRFLKIAILAVALSGLSLNAYAKETITINGSTTVLPIMQSVIEAYMAANPSVQIELSGGGSGNGIKALAEGQTMIAMSSRDIKENEVKQAKEKNVNPYKIAVAIDALVPVVHPSNKIDELNAEQLKNIFNGTTKNWQELGGADAKIVIISRDTSSGTYETWAEMIMKNEKVVPSALMQASSGAVVQAVSKNKNAIGYIGIGYLDKSTKGLKMNGKVANATTALSKEWQLSRELYVFTNGEPKGEIAKFVKYMLDPNLGQKAVKQVGFVPLGK